MYRVITEQAGEGPSVDKGCEQSSGRQKLHGGVLTIIVGQRRLLACRRYAAPVPPCSTERMSDSYAFTHPRQYFF